MTYSKKVKPLEIGTQYGEWTVLSFSHIGTNKAKPAFWNCQCSCGKIKAVNATMLRMGRSDRCRNCSSKVVGRLGLDSRAKTHLYIARCGDYFKIGSSDDPERRIRDLQSSCPYPITCEAIFWDRGHEEPDWHQHHKAQMHRGEWFTGHCEII